MGLWINEFSSYSSDDWVEIYNDSSDPVTLGIYQLRDETESHNITLVGEIAPRGFVVVDYNNYLNKGGDTIKLVSASNKDNIFDQVQYGSSGDDVAAPGDGQSAGRSSDGDTQWVIFATDSKEHSNNDSSVVPTITPTPSKTPTPVNSPTPKNTPTPTKAPTPIKSGQASVEDEITEKNNPSVKRKTAKTSSSTRTSVASMSGMPTSILGASKSALSKAATKSASNKKRVLIDSAKQDGNLMGVFFVVGAAFLLGCGILIYLKKKKAQ